MSELMPTHPVLRFAPSPNGYLHMGHAYSALLNQALADHFGGRLLLRCEDIDRGRCRPAYEAALYEDLAWLGLRWEEPVRRQSEHFDLYQSMADGLRARDLLYPCFCSRRERAMGDGARGRDPDGVLLYDGRCRELTAHERHKRVQRGDAHVWRIDMARAMACVGDDLYWRSRAENGVMTSIAAQPQLWGDVVIVRRDIPTSYHLSVVVDDALQDVNFVVRGQDLYEATHIHRLLQALLDVPTPLYHHHQLMRTDGGDKLSKSKPQPFNPAQIHLIREARAQGMSAGDVRAYVGF